ncbi:ester cyclase [Nocardia colli]|uniref:ester cyclase n=1 Tax=Nocardia colli TaxID=2545717 RepID=UPI00168CDBF8|nr:ester cyclase [Nocardia colli]
MNELLDLVHTHYNGLESGDLDLAASPFADDVAAVFPTGPLDGIDALRNLIDSFITAFPDLTIDRRTVWQDGDTAIAEVSFSGTQTGPLATATGEVPASGRRVTFDAVDIFTARSGKVVEHRGYWDNATFLTQLGLLPDSV